MEIKLYNDGNFPIAIKVEEKKGETLPSKFIYCDVRKPIELDVPVSSEDVIFNFAAVHRTPGHPDHEYFETNIRGAENVCAFAERHGIKKIVFTSSIAPYGAAEELKGETTLPTPNTPSVGRRTGKNTPRRLKSS